MHYTGQVYRHPIEGNTPLSRKSDILKAFEDNIYKIPQHILNGVQKRENI